MSAERATKPAAVIVNFTDSPRTESLLKIVPPGSVLHGEFTFRFRNVDFNLVRVNLAFPRPEAKCCWLFFLEVYSCRTGTGVVLAEGSEVEVDVDFVAFRGDDVA